MLPPGVLGSCAHRLCSILFSLPHHLLPQIPPAPEYSFSPWWKTRGRETQPQPAAAWGWQGCSVCPCAAASGELWVLQKHPWVPTGAGDSLPSAVLVQDGECSSTHTVRSSSLVWPGPAAHSRLTPLFQITKLPQSPRSHLASQERAGGCFEIRVGAWPAAVLKATAGLLCAATRHTQSAPALGRGP